MKTRILSNRDWIGIHTDVDSSVPTGTTKTNQLPKNTSSKELLQRNHRLLLLLLLQHY